jgi:hypothetical protein
MKFVRKNVQNPRSIYKDLVDLNKVSYKRKKHMKYPPDPMPPNQNMARWSRGGTWPLE